MHCHFVCLVKLYHGVHCLNIDQDHIYYLFWFFKGLSAGVWYLCLSVDTLTSVRRASGVCDHMTPDNCYSVRSLLANTYDVMTALV